MPTENPQAKGYGHASRLPLNIVKQCVVPEAMIAEQIRLSLAYLRTEKGIQVTDGGIRIEIDVTIPLGVVEFEGGQYEDKGTVAVTVEATR